MHQVFNIPEIVTIIAEQGLNQNDCSIRHGILSLAQTCQSLYEPVANVIWQHIPSLQHLVECIPSGIRENASGQFNGNLEIRPVRPQDLSRLQLNARRVRCYGSAAVPWQVDATRMETFRILGLLNGGSALLPNLREATLNHMTADVLPFVHLITPLQLTRLSITVEFGSMSRKELFEYLSFLNSIGSRYPLLKNLQITITEERVAEVGPNTLADIFLSSQWENLSSVKIAGLPVSCRALRPLLHSNTLRSICMWFEGPGDMFEELATNNVSPFLPETEQLILDFENWQQGTDFLKVLGPRASPVRKIAFAALESVGMPDFVWRKLCECIRTTFRNTDALEDISLDDDAIGELPLRLTLNDINPLLDFRRLQKIRIFSNRFLDLDEPDLRHLAMTWTQAREFTLVGGGSNTAEPPKVTLQVLVAFADFCPNIETLGIEVDARESSTSFPGPESPPRGYKLKAFNAYMSPIGGPGIVAAFISDIFPNIEKVVCGWKGAGTGSFVDKGAADAWGQVDDLVNVFAHVRHEESQRNRG